MKRDTLRGTLVMLFSFASLALIAVGLRFAIHSPLFLVQVVEIGDQPEGSPVDSQTISELADVSVGKVNLYELDLKAVEKRVLVHPWIRQVNLQKRFPQTLSISVMFREPKALLQDKSGGLAYIDTDGTVFGSVNVLARSDLPMISGVEGGDSARIKDALLLIDSWESSSLAGLSQLSSLQWDPERGFRAWIVYSAQSSRSRTIVDLGQDLDPAALEAQFRRLGEVVLYLNRHSVPARQIWADSGKKIVVRTSHGS